MADHRIRLDIPPAAASRWKANFRGGGTFGVVYKRFRKLAKERLPALAMMAGIDSPLDSPLHVQLDIRVERPKTSKLPFPKPDIDNYAKAALDVASGILWVDDWQIWRLNQTKLWLPLGEEGYVHYHFEEEDPPWPTKIQPLTRP